MSSTIRENYEAVKIKLTSMRIPSWREVVNEAKAYKDNLQEGVLDATDPGYSYWENMRTPVVVLGLLVIFWMICWWTAARQDEGRPVSDSLYGFFLTFQLYSFFINMAIFFTPLLIWFAQSKFLRLLTLGIEAAQRKYGMAMLVRAYVGLQLLLFLNSILQLIQREQNPRGRTIRLFHEGLKPIKAWVYLKYCPGGALTTFMLMDMVFDYVLSMYHVLEGVYRNVYGSALEMVTRVVCMLEIAMHVLTMARLSLVVTQQNLSYSTPFLSWICFYCGFSCLCLLVVLAGMGFTYWSTYKCSHRREQSTT